MRARRSVIAVLVVAAVGCFGKDPYDPGTRIGTFHVSARLASSTCGPTPDPWAFDVRLNYEGSTLYWVQGGAPVGGLLDEGARVQLSSEIVQEVRAADRKARRDACSLTRTDAVAVALATAEQAPALDPAQATSFAGTLVYTFAPTAGSDCEDQVSASGGGFDALPCEIRYELAGTLAASP